MSFVGGCGPGRKTSRMAAATAARVRVTHYAPRGATKKDAAADKRKQGCMETFKELETPKDATGEGERWEGWESFRWHPTWSPTPEEKACVRASPPVLSPLSLPGDVPLVPSAATRFAATRLTRLRCCRWPILPWRPPTLAAEVQSRCIHRSK